jgi:23S rRNA (adenine2503-C2)-methyltransferase
MNKIPIKSIVSKTDTHTFSPSINHIIPFGKSYLEARYVRREDLKISTYVSSHSGCNQGCKFCWLTQNNQTSFDHASISDYEMQLQTILSKVPPKDNEFICNYKIRVNVNFMARGEPLANKSVINEYPSLYDRLLLVVNKHGYKKMNMNVSTIMPLVIKPRALIEIFREQPVNIYYSLYSNNEAFKKGWMPNAMPVELALDKLAEFQHLRAKLNGYEGETLPSIIFHGAFIKGQNDSLELVHSMAEAIKRRQFIKSKFHLVRLNPHKLSGIEEPDEKRLQTIFEIMNDAVQNNTLTSDSRIIHRVGFDVKASCGTFFTDNEIDIL